MSRRVTWIEPKAPDSLRPRSGCRLQPSRIGFGPTNKNTVSAMTASGEERIRELTQRMLRKRLYVILSKGNASPEQLGALVPQHLEYMIGLEKKGVLFASGPFTVPSGQPVGDGLTIVRAASADEARAIAEVDPFVVNKLRTFEVREWTVMEGSLGITINFSDQSLQIA